MTSDYTMVDGVLCYVTTRSAYRRQDGPARPVNVVLGSLRETMIREAHAGHSESHGGTKETLDKLAEVAHWPGMYSDVAEFVQRCVTCQQAKKPRYLTHAPGGTPRFGYAPMDALSVDHADLPMLETAHGNKYILVVTDLFTRYLWCFAVRDRTAEMTAYVLNDLVFQPFGTPRALVSDRGPTFMGQVCQCLLTMHNVKHCPTTAYRPQANGVIERMNGVIKERLRALTLTPKTWDEYLSIVTSSYNRSIHRATGFAPLHALFMREPFTPSARMLGRGLDPEFDSCELRQPDAARMPQDH